MSDISLPRSGYTANRSPSAFAAAIAINGGVFALLLAIPAAEVIKEIYTPISVTNVRLRPLPPEAKKPEPKQAHKPMQTVIPQSKPIDTIVPPIADPSTDFIVRDVDPIGPIGGGQGILPDPTPPPSVFTKAKFNPRYADGFKPDYPPGLRREGIEGSVTVRVTIDERGRVTVVELVKTTDQRFFEETKQQALRYWRFEPARRDGIAVTSDQTMTVHFKLEDDQA